MKRISQLSPPPNIGRERAEQHYAEVHHPFARKMFREHGHLMTRYVANLALAQHDLNGHFLERPTGWRFVITEVSDEIANASEWIPAHMQELIWVDHQKCIVDIRASEVEASVLVDRRSGQVSSAKYLLFFSAVNDDMAGLRETYREHAATMQRHFADAYGARLFISNEVRRQAETADAHGSGDAYTGGYADRTAFVAIEELYFDNVGWGGEFFAAPPIVELMRSSVFGHVEGYQVREDIGVDKT